jgi:hypothetical protein
MLLWEREGKMNDCRVKICCTHVPLGESRSAVKFMEFLCFSKHRFCDPQDHKKRGFLSLHIKKAANSTRCGKILFPDKNSFSDRAAMCFSA